MTTKSKLSSTEEKCGSRLVEILKLHAALHQNIIVRTPEETAIWKRNEDGTLHKIQVVTRKGIVGTYAWRKMHGIST